MERTHLPDSTRLSVLTATVLLAFAMTRIITAPHIDLSLPLPGFFLSFSINLNLVIVILTGGLVATGTSWLLGTHPSLQKGEAREHWLLPTLTVLVIGIALNSLPKTAVWWLGFGVGAVLLLVVLFAEYVAVDPTDARYPLSTAVLTILAFVMFLILASAVKAANARLVMVLPALFLTAALASLRTLHLRLNERWEVAWAFGIGLIATQLGAALHYLPLSPIRYGLALLGPVYGATVLGVNLLEGSPFRRAWVEPAAMLAVFLGLTVWFH